MFIAGFLSLSHLMKISLPCGPTKGCDTVATHASSYLIGNPVDGGLPVAYVGFLGYLLLTALSVFRAAKQQENSKPLAILGFLASLIGTIFSGYLIYVTINVIHATCNWCVASAVTMVLTTIVSAAMLQADPSPEPKKPKLDLLIAGILTIVVAGGLIGGSNYLKSKGETLDGGLAFRVVENKLDIAAPGSHVLGDPNAPVTIVEFADLMCPSCQQSFAVLSQLVSDGDGKIRLVFHHFPLFMKPEHKMAVPAASIAEMAGEENKFFQFVAAIYSKQLEQLQTPESLLEIAESVGLDPEVVRKRLNDQNDPAIKRVTDDMNLANEIKINSTPTLFLVPKGGKPEIVAPSQLEKRLNEEPYSTLLKGFKSGS